MSHINLSEITTRVRELTSHRVNGVNEAIRIFAVDEPSANNACHEFIICVPACDGDEHERIEGQVTADIHHDVRSEDPSVTRTLTTDDDGMETITYVPHRGMAVVDRPVAGKMHRETFKVHALNFQRGVRKDEGVNGVTNEALLAILIDRFEGFQEGPSRCHDVQLFLDHLSIARLLLHKRTVDRATKIVKR